MTRRRSATGGRTRAIPGVWGAAVLLAGLLACAATPSRPAEPDSVTVRPPNGSADQIEALIEQGTLAMRTDPDTSKQVADSALELLKKNPNPDLEIRARLLLCDYQSERDTAAAQREIAAATAL